MGGTLRVELNHQDPHVLPEALRDQSNDHRILSVAKTLADEGFDTVVVTKDLPLRLKPPPSAYRPTSIAASSRRRTSGPASPSSTRHRAS